GCQAYKKETRRHLPPDVRKRREQQSRRDVRENRRAAAQPPQSGPSGYQGPPRQNPWGPTRYPPPATFGQYMAQAGVNPWTPLQQCSQGYNELEYPVLANNPWLRKPRGPQGPKKNATGHKNGQGKPQQPPQERAQQPARDKQPAQPKPLATRLAPAAPAQRTPPPRQPQVAPAPEADMLIDLASEQPTAPPMRTEQPAQPGLADFISDDEAGPTPRSQQPIATATESPKRAPRIKPLFVFLDQGHQYPRVYTALKQSVQEKFTCQNRGRDEIQVNVASVPDYHRAVKALQAIGAQHSVLLQRDEVPKKFVLRGVHRHTPSEFLQEEFSSLILPVQNHWFLENRQRREKPDRAPTGSLSRARLQRPCRLTANCAPRPQPGGRARNTQLRRASRGRGTNSRRPAGKPEPAPRRAHSWSGSLSILRLSLSASFFVQVPDHTISDTAPPQEPTNMDTTTSVPPTDSAPLMVPASDMAKFRAWLHFQEKEKNAAEQREEEQERQAEWTMQRKRQRTTAPAVRPPEIAVTNRFATLAEADASRPTAGPSSAPSPPAPAPANQGAAAPSTRTPRDSGPRKHALRLVVPDQSLYSQLVARMRSLAPGAAQISLVREGLQIADDQAAAEHSNLASELIGRRSAALPLRFASRHQ
ncbi:protein piccolo-like, partial [Bacillus rossius redtenbacheri]|uniref:protein piccolo-like n=1 Tax=Bacillus rossius redtenbacheri TaxID=93214 RepID=UPI002FDED718